MSFNTFGRMFRFTSWGESHGPALGATVDGCPPGVALDEGFIQRFLDRRRPGQSKMTTQRQEPDAVRILSGVFEGRTTGTPIQLMIENTDQRIRDYGDIAQAFRPGHADITYHQKYGLRDYRGGGRSSARETAARVAAGGVAQAVLGDLLPDLRITGYMVQMGERHIDRARIDLAQIERNDFFCPDATAAAEWADYLTGIRKDQDSVGAAVEVLVQGCPPGLGAPVYAKLDTDLAAAMMSINAVKGVEIGEGMRAAALTRDRQCRRNPHGPDRPGIPVEPRRRHPGGDFHRAGHHRALRRQADLVDPDATPHHRRQRARTGPGHQGPPRPLRGHPRRPRGRGDGGVRDPGPSADGSRPDGRRARASTG